MRIIKHILGFVFLTIIMASFSKCSSAHNLQKEAPTVFNEVYFEQWVSGMAQGPSGINIFIEVKNDNVHLDSVYFRSKGAKLEVVNSNNHQYIGRFISKATEKRDIIMHKDASQEYGNQAPEIPVNVPFKLEPNECVVSYKINGKTKYYKITNIIEKESNDHPM
jgi:hypothetical protein